MRADPLTGTRRPVLLAKKSWRSNAAMRRTAVGPLSCPSDTRRARRPLGDPRWTYQMRPWFTSSCVKLLTATPGCCLFSTEPIFESRKILVWHFLGKEKFYFEIISTVKSQYIINPSCASANKSRFSFFCFIIGAHGAFRREGLNTIVKCIIFLFPDKRPLHFL